MADTKAHRYTGSWWRALLGDGQAAMNFQKDVRVWSEMAVRDCVCRALKASEAEVETLEAKATRNRGFADFYRRKALNYKAEVEALRRTLEGLAVDCESGMIATEADDSGRLSRAEHDKRIAARCRAVLPAAGKPE